MGIRRGRPGRHTPRRRICLSRKSERGDQVELSNRKIYHIPIDAISENPYQPRRYFSDENLFELAQSIARYGLLQPISVRPTARGYELIAGERRLRACAMLGCATIDAVVMCPGEQDSAILAMIENIQRENLHFLEEAEGYLNILRTSGMSQEELARRIGKNQCTIANKIRLLKLPPAIRKRIVSENLTERQARALLRLHDETMALRALDMICERGLNVKETDALIESMLDEMYRQPAPPRRRVTTLLADTRLFLNSFKEIVARMNGAGYASQYRTTRLSDRIEVQITIPLRDPEQRAAAGAP